MTDETRRLKCACGWEASGTVDEVVAATQDHAKRVHNMEATREDVLARLEGAATSSD